MGVDTIEFKPLWLIYRAKTTGGRGKTEAQLEAPAKILCALEDVQGVRSGRFWTLLQRQDLFIDQM